jgi:hypothetical protein
MSVAKEATLVIGPYHPLPTESYVYSIVSDESVMFEPVTSLSELCLRQYEMLERAFYPCSMGFLVASKPGDQVVLSDQFLQERELMDWHLTRYSDIGFDVASAIHFVPRDEMYRKAINVCAPGQKIIATCYSFELDGFQDITRMLAISRSVNSKMNLSTYARKGGFHIPQSIVVAAGELLAGDWMELFDFPRKSVVIKSDGLGGGCNVRTVSSQDELVEAAEMFKASGQLTVQELLDHQTMRETVTEVKISPNQIEIHNIRQKLVNANQWFGNVFSPKNTLSPEDRRNVLRCADHLRRQSYCSSEGPLNCGIDSFCGEASNRIIEVNARLTGGLPAALLVERLGLEQEIVASYLDSIHCSEASRYFEFVIDHLLQRGVSVGPFKLIPVSFSPCMTNGLMDVWLMVVGDYEVFAQAVSQLALSRSLQKTEMVRALIREKVCRGYL